MSTVNFSDERTQLVANVRPATFRDDIKRLAMQEAAMQVKYEDTSMLGAATFTYPRLICCTPSGKLAVDGVDIPWPPTLDQLLEVSVGAADAWYFEAKRCNPGWFEINLPVDEAGEKKVPEKQPTKD